MSLVWLIEGRHEEISRGMCSLPKGCYPPSSTLSFYLRPTGFATAVVIIDALAMKLAHLNSQICFLLATDFSY